MISWDLIQLPDQMFPLPRISQMMDKLPLSKSKEMPAPHWNMDYQSMVNTCLLTRQSSQ